MKPGFLVVMCLAGSLLAGCSLTKSGSSSTRGGLSFFGQRQIPDQDDEPEPEKPDTDWDYVGKQARGDTSLARDSDPLAKLIEHPTSLEIKRNLRMDD